MRIKQIRIQNRTEPQRTTQEKIHQNPRKVRIRRVKPKKSQDAVHRTRLKIRTRGRKLKHC